MANREETEVYDIPVTVVGAASNSSDYIVLHHIYYRLHR